MSLFEMFTGDSSEDALKNVLDGALLSAEGKGGASWSGSDDMRRTWIDGKTHPDFIDDPQHARQLSAEKIAFYNKWVEANRPRIEAVIAELHSSR